MKKHPFRGCTILVFLSFVFIWSGAGIAGEDSTQKGPDTYYDEGTEFLRKGEVDNAITSFTSSIDLLKDKTVKTDDEKKLLAEAYNNRGLAYYEKEQYSPAEDDFNDSCLWDPTNKKAISNLALTYFEQHRYLDAKYKYQEALPASDGSDEKPYHADVYNNLGVCYMETGDATNALKYYDKAIALAEANDAVDYTDAYFNKGNLYYNDKKYDQAIPLYTVTIEYFVDTLKDKVEAGILDRAYHNRALCYYNKGMYQEAINDYIKALEINPNYAWARYGKGYAHFMLNQNDAAITEYNTIIEMPASGIDYWAQFGLGLAWCRKGDFDKGLKYLNESCDSGSCPDACDTLEQNKYADPGYIMNFQLPE
jgi:pentatricopeptide repeat protein